MDRGDTMSVVTKTVIDTQTNTETVVEMTEEEIAELTLIRENALAELAAKEALEAAKTVARVSAEAKLIALGLTVEEIAALK